MVICTRVSNVLGVRWFTGMSDDDPRTGIDVQEGTGVNA
jgi:hypothetical protein